MAQAQQTLVFLCIRLFPPRPASLQAIFNPSLGLYTIVRALLESHWGWGDQGKCPTSSSSKELHLGTARCKAGARLRSQAKPLTGLGLSISETRGWTGQCSCPPHFFRTSPSYPSFCFPSGRCVLRSPPPHPTAV